MNVQIKTREGEKISLLANPTDLIGELKKKIQEKEGLEINQQKIIFNGENCLDERSLKDYNIQDGVNLLLINKEKSLLFKNSIIFDGSNLIDRIRQSIIDINDNSQEEDVLNLVNEAISYLDDILDIDTTKELINLLLCCFSFFPEQSLKLLDKCLQKDRITVYHIIVSASIFFNLAIFFPEIPLKNYDDFVSNSFQQISQQIEKSPDDNLKVFGVEIPREFKNSFIMSIVLLSKPTEELVSKFHKYIICKGIGNSQINYFVKKVSDAGLLNLILESLLSQDCLILNLSFENITNLISLLTEQTFRKILPRIEDIITTSKKIDPSFCNVLINKLIQFDVKINSIQILFNQIETIEINSKVYDYLIKYQIQLPEKIASQIKDISKYPCILTLFEHPEKLPDDFLSFALKEAKDFKIYEKVLSSSEINSSVFSTLEFWKHILSLVSSSEKECSKELISKFASYFQKNIKIEDIENIYDSLIFDDSLPDDKQSEFLFKLIKSMNYKYYDELTKWESCTNRNSKVIKQKTIPCPSLCKLFYLNTSLIGKSPTPKNLYIFEFSKYREYDEIHCDLEILPGSDEMSDVLIQFINQNNNFAIIRNINEKTLSLIACSLIYTSEKKHKNISGLTKENVLPFYAICLNYLTQKKKGDLIKSSTEMLDLLFEACKSLNSCQIPLMNESINSILSNNKLLFGSSIFPSKTAFQIFELLCSFLINEKYQADKLLIILTLFQLSIREKTPVIYDNILLIAKKYGIQLFESILKCKNMIIKDERFNDYSISLKLFDGIELKNTILNELEKAKSDEEIIQLICFITKCCQNIPQFNILETTVNLLNQICRKIIDGEKWDEYILFVQFMKNMKIPVDFEILKEKSIPFNISEKLMKYPDFKNIKNLIMHIINDPKIELHNNLFEKIFDLLMKELSIAYRYVLSSIEKISSEMEVKPGFILEHKTDVFNQYNDILILVLKQAYAYCPRNASFIRKIDAEPINLPDIDFSFLGILINDQSYQSFMCLHYIASYFPFLFLPDASIENKSHYLLVVELVLPTFNCLSTIYDDQELSEEKVDNYKKAISALSFLFSCLNSTQFTSEFVQWIFANIEHLSDSQIICMSPIICSLLSMKDVNIIVLGYAAKYNLLEKMIYLLSRDISDKKFEQLYKRSLYEILTNHIKSIIEISHYEDALLIDQIKNGTITNPFEVMFNNFSIISSNCSLKLQIMFPIENESTKMIVEFMNKINTKQPFWISNISHNYILDKKSIVSKFVTLFKNEKYVYIDEVLPYPPYPNTIKMQRYYNAQPKWIFNFIKKYMPFPKLPEHHLSLYQTISKLKEIEQNSKTNPSEEDVKAPNKIGPFNYTSDLFYNEQLFRKIIDELMNTLQNTQCLYSLIIEYTQNTKSMKTFLNIIGEFISKLKSDYPYGQSIFLSRLAQVIFNCWRSNYDFDENFFKICGNQFIDISFGFRMTNTLNLSNAAYILICLNCEIPIRATQIIGFICKYYPECIPNALGLYSKLGEKKSSNVFPIIKKSYENEIKKEIPSYINLKHYLEVIPSLAKNDISYLYNLINKSIAKYKQDECKDDNLRDLICELFNFLSPERDQYQLIYSPKSTEIDFTQTLSNKKCKLKLENEPIQSTLLEPAPQSLLQSSSSKFWVKLYEKYRHFLSELIEKDELNFEKLTFLHVYHELVPFRIRSSYFRKYLKTLENHRNIISINVSRSNILNDTFNSLVNKKPKELLGDFHVHFADEIGADAGGLTREWFTYIVKEIFNPDFGLFLKNESNEYHPNPLSYINQNHIQYFKLAGEIIALALVKGQCVNAHLSMAFYRQILHQKIKLKDLEDFDNSLFNSLQMVLDADDVKDLDLVFSIDDDQFGKMTTIELIENGEQIEVTNENRMKYVNLYANYKLRKSVIKQISAFCDAFDEIIPSKFIRIFSPSELDLMICGIPKVDVKDMQRYTHYEPPYHKEHPTIVMFFNMISKWDQENLAKFLLFLTGSSQVSVNGFKDFEDGGKPILIAPGGEKNRLPVAHTCFKRLDLPQYDSEDDMKEKLLIAIQDCEFGLV
ncbi:hypothetical protein M9Y10_019395 [Tritrichomonas musculus]|uniref:HECT-type E3 ubiquitin transferase n=1 Tax=Tritrichomonas musculus TaxID=1915356 RepID=A0ABR2HJB9_9EUKA